MSGKRTVLYCVRNRTVTKFLCPIVSPKFCRPGAVTVRYLQRKSKELYQYNYTHITTPIEKTMEVLAVTAVHFLDKSFGLKVKVWDDDSGNFLGIGSRDDLVDQILFNPVNIDAGKQSDSPRSYTKSFGLKVKVWDDDSGNFLGVGSRDDLVDQILFNPVNIDAGKQSDSPRSYTQFVKRDVVNIMVIATNPMNVCLVRQHLLAIDALEND
ncbi:hypothetical protein AC249_AIPGENE19683 [Exaiptasia diaphana]|nr:hypothetical protein AC249_AIPGENE19683 [Exaiptasia diaphana]